MKKVVIIHCWEGYPNYCWYPDTKKELESKGYQVIVPDMPETDFPKLNGWLSKLREVVEETNENVYLIGHSLGCITILRYLESLKENEKVGGAILVAGFTDNLEYKEIKSFFEAPIDFEKKPLELVPEVYLDEREPTEEEMQEDVENLVRETIAFLIRSRREG